MNTVLVYLLRHGIAEDGAGKPDSERALTAEGKKKLREVLAVAARAGVSPELIVSSPYRRAMETARVAAEELGYNDEILRTQALTPGATPAQAWDEIRLHLDRASVLLAGHEPLFSLLGAYLLGAPEVQIDFKKGALMSIEMPPGRSRPKGVLKWLLTPRLAGEAPKPSPK